MYPKKWKNKILHFRPILETASVVIWHYSCDLYLHYSWHQILSTCFKSLDLFLQLFRDIWCRKSQLESNSFKIFFDVTNGHPFWQKATLKHCPEIITAAMAYEIMQFDFSKEKKIFEKWVLGVQTCLFRNLVPSYFRFAYFKLWKCFSSSQRWKNWNCQKMHSFQLVT